MVFKKKIISHFSVGLIAHNIDFIDNKELVIKTTMRKYFFNK